MTVAAAEQLLDACLFAPDQLADSLDEAGRLLGVDYFVIGHADVTQHRIIASDRLRVGTDEYFNGGWAELDWRVRDAGLHIPGRVYLEHQAPDWDQHRASDIYNEFFRAFDMCHYAGIRFPMGGSEWFCTVMRGEAKGVIDGTEAAAFNRLGQAAIRVASFIARLQETRVGGMLEGLEVSKTPAIVLDRHGRVLEVTSAAEAFFDHSLNVSSGRLWASSADDAAILDGVERFARSPLPAPPLSTLLRGKAHERPVRIDASRIVGCGPDQLSGGSVLLRLSDMGAGNRAFAHELYRRFQLTPAEADVVGQFGEGRSILEIAQRRRVAESTIREQMKSIYRKIGVQRQVDLMRVITGLKG